MEQTLGVPLSVAQIKDRIDTITNFNTKEDDPIVTASTSLLNKIDVLVKIGDDIAKVCSSYTLYVVSL